MVRLGQEWEIDIVCAVGKCIEFQKKFFQNFNIFFCFENDLSVIFGFVTPKLITIPVFIKIQWTKLEIWTKMHCQDFQDGRQEDEREGLWSKLLIVISQKLFEIEPSQFGPPPIKGGGSKFWLPPPGGGDWKI